MPAKESNLQTLRIVVGELEENCFLLWRKGSDQALIFDPGDEAPSILDELKKRQLKPAAWMVTHAHCDHIGALADLKKAFPAVPIMAPEAEADRLTNPTLNLSYFITGGFSAPAADRLIKPNEMLDVGGFKTKAMLCTGHSPGSTAYYVEDPDGASHLFSGDIIFSGGIGRTDFPGGSGESALIDNIHSIIFTLPNDTVIHPGHGPETTVGQEKAFNPICGTGTDIA